jgi:thioredoxin 1
MQETRQTTDMLDQIVTDHDLPVLVYFWAGWCSDCRRFSPIFDQIEIEFHRKVKTIKVDTEKYMDIAQQFTVMSIPTLLMLKDGKEVLRIVEEYNKEQIIRSIDKELAEKIENRLEG